MTLSHNPVNICQNIGTKLHTNHKPEGFSQSRVAEVQGASYSTVKSLI